MREETSGSSHLPAPLSTAVLIKFPIQALWGMHTNHSSILLVFSAFSRKQQQSRWKEVCALVDLWVFLSYSLFWGGTLLTHYWLWVTTKHAWDDNYIHDGFLFTGAVNLALCVFQRDHTPALVYWSLCEFLITVLAFLLHMDERVAVDVLPLHA